MASVTMKTVATLRPAWSDTSDTMNPISEAPSIDIGQEMTYNASPSTATQMSRLYSGTLTFSGTTPQTLDLDNIADQILGAGSAFTAVKFCYLKNTSSTGTLTVTGDWFTNVFPSCTGLVLNPGQYIILSRVDTTGMVVTATTADELTITPTDGGTLQVILAGK